MSSRSPIEACAVPPAPDTQPGERVYVRPDGGQLRALARPLADGQLKVAVALGYGLPDAADALATVVSERAAGAVALAR